MSAYTQGKWLARPDPSSNPGDHPQGDYVIGVGEEIDCVAVCSPLANARLIAAAPELLEAVAMLAEDLEDGHWQCTKERLRELVAKATGA